MPSGRRAEHSPRGCKGRHEGFVNDSKTMIKLRGTNQRNHSGTNFMKTGIWRFTKHIRCITARSWLRCAVIFLSGAAALVWFLVRVIPKPSRASYPCQRAAFPVASGFVIWLCGVLAIKSGLNRLAPRPVRGLLRDADGAGGGGVDAGFVYRQRRGAERRQASTDWNFIPAKPNEPVGIARGINPGRVVWARDPQATKWAGNWKQKSDQWWLDANTDQARVDAMLAATLLKLTSATNGEQAWQAIFEYYNKNSRGMAQRGYQPGEVVAVKINLNNSRTARRPTTTPTPRRRWCWPWCANSSIRRTCGRRTSSFMTSAASSRRTCSRRCGASSRTSVSSRLRRPRRASPRIRATAIIMAWRRRIGSREWSIPTANTRTPN